MSTKEARFGFFIGSPTLNIENCLDLKIRETVENTYNITDEQIEIICLAFSNEKDQEHLHNEISKQRIAMSLFAVMLLYFFFAAIKRSAKLSAARKIHEKLA